LLKRADLFWHDPQSRDSEEAVEEVAHKSLWLVNRLDLAAISFALRRMISAIPNGDMKMNRNRPQIHVI
jgi:hypothetical protein